MGLRGAPRASLGVSLAVTIVQNSAKCFLQSFLFFRRSPVHGLREARSSNIVTQRWHLGEGLQVLVHSVLVLTLEEVCGWGHSSNVLEALLSSKLLVNDLLPQAVVVGGHGIHDLILF